MKNERGVCFPKTLSNPNEYPIVTGIPIALLRRKLRDLRTWMNMRGGDLRSL